MSKKVNEFLQSEEAILKVLNNKLQISNKAKDLLKVSVGDRLEVAFWTENNQSTFPLIGKSKVFTDELNGNVLTKSNTISFRGQQRDILLEYGSMFEIKPFKQEIFKLEKIDNEK